MRPYIHHAQRLTRPATTKPVVVSSIQCRPICHDSLSMPSCLNRERGDKTYPKDELRITTVPAATLMLSEEAPITLVEHVWLHHSDSMLHRSLSGEVLRPQDTEKQRTSGVHDSDVREAPIPIVLLELLNDAKEEWMLRHGCHDIV